MAEIRLYRIGDTVTELPAEQVSLERELQTLIEKNMENIFGVRFLRSEYVITDGRMDSIGLDENNAPVIFEYKRNSSESIINQGLFYLDWLMDHKADFQLLVKDVLGEETSKNINWAVPCVICIANAFNKFDIHAVKQMRRDIRLVKYKKYGDLILFEHLQNPTNASNTVKSPADKPSDSCDNLPVTNYETVFNRQREKASQDIQELYDEVESFILSLAADDDVTRVYTKMYVAFRKVRNIICIKVQKDALQLTVSLNPDTVILEKDFTRDMRNTGHHGTGDLEIVLRTMSDLERAKPLLERAYNEN